MSKRLQLALGMAVVLLLGVVIGQAIDGRAQAQQAPRVWRECFAASLWGEDGGGMANPNFRPRVVRIPAGWVPVGGSGNPSAHTVVLCR